VANLHYQIFQMVGATRGNPHGFGEASGRNLPPPPPPPNMTPMENFVLAQAGIMRQILQNQQQMNQWLSVRNVVPTLTSNKRRGLSLNGRC
jgi:hypothetical protein